MNILHENKVTGKEKGRKYLVYIIRLEYNLFYLRDLQVSLRGRKEEMEMKTHKIRDTIFLFLTAMIWGAAFVAQSISMDYIGPFTFICLRSVIGGLFLIPVIMVIDNIRKKRRSESVKTASDNGINSFQKMQAEEEKLSWKNKRLLESGIVCGIFLFLANCFQQTGIQYTTVGKAGFITTFYIIIVPVVGLFF